MSRGTPVKYGRRVGPSVLWDPRLFIAIEAGLGFSNSLFCSSPYWPPSKVVCGRPVSRVLVCVLRFASAAAGPQAPFPVDPTHATCSGGFAYSFSIVSIASSSNLNGLLRVEPCSLGKVISPLVRKQPQRFGTDIPVNREIAVIMRMPKRPNFYLVTLEACLVR